MTHVVAQPNMASAIACAPASGRARLPRVTVAMTVEQVMELRDEWSALRRNRGVISMDAEPGLFCDILPALGDAVTPYVAIFRQNDEPIAALVGRRSHRAPVPGPTALIAPRLEVLEIVCGGLITDGTRESADAVIAHLTDLLDGRQIDMLDIHHLDAEHELAASLSAGLERRARVSQRPEGHCRLSLCDLQTGQRLHHNSSKTRSTFRRKDRKLCEFFENRTEVRELHGAETLNELLRVAGSINANTYQAALACGIEDTLRWRTILGALASRSAMHGYVLMGNGVAIAYVVGAVLHGQFTLLATGFLPEHQSLSPGLVLLNRIFDLLTAERVMTVDFGFGDADYKRILANQRSLEFTLHLYARRWKPTVAWGFERWFGLMKFAAKRGLAWMGIFDAAKRRWRRWLESKSAPSTVGETE
jgi:hypothetical protein